MSIFKKKDKHNTANCWICSKCKTENSYSTNKCIECHSVNHNIEIIKNDNKESFLFDNEKKNNSKPQTKYICSECNTVHYSLYCPNCGAKARKEYLSSIPPAKSKNNFSPTTNKNFSKYIELDEKNNKFTFGGDGKVYNYRQLVSYELIENEDTLIKSKGAIGRAAVGGFVAGGVGAIIGASTSKKQTHQNVSKLEIHIIISPGSQIKRIQLISSPVKKGGFNYNVSIALAENIIAQLKTIEQKNLQNVSNTGTTADEIKKYKELLDCGAITQEEYNAKKKQLLNL